VDNSSDGEPVICAICLDTITTQRVGTLDVCKHTFCDECIKQWASYKNICPIDRQKLKYVFTRLHHKGKNMYTYKYNEKLHRLEYCSGTWSCYKIFTIFLIIMVALWIILL
jgi:hypothetical protein